MPSAVLSTSAAMGRPFVFEEADDESRLFSDVKKPASAEFEVAQAIQSAIKNHKSAIAVTPASHLAIRPVPEMASSGIAALDALTGGLPRGCLTEICGPASSGRTSVMLAALAAATRRGEFCAVVDAGDALDPQSLTASGVELERLLWVRCGEPSPRKTSSPQRHRDTEKTKNGENGCSTSAALFAAEVGICAKTSFRFDSRERFRASEHRLDQALRATDLLLESGGFGLIVLDFADLPLPTARRIPLTTWFRFRRAVENKPTILLALEQQAIAGSCSSLLLQLGGSTQYSAPGTHFSNATYPSHSHLFTGLAISMELIRSRLERKPARSVAFETRTAWAG